MLLPQVHPRSQRPEYKKESAVTDSCIPVTVETVGGERVVTDDTDQVDGYWTRTGSRGHNVSDQELETTEGEGVDLLAELLDLLG